MRTREPNKTLSLVELRAKIQAHKEKGRKIIAEVQIFEKHWERMQEYYSGWEDELNEIQKQIDEVAREHNVPVEQVQEYNALDDVFGD